MNILDQGTSFSVNFKWTGDASTVKAFPYIKVDPSRMPVQLWNVSTLDFSGKWSMLVQGTENASSHDQAVAYDNIGLKANVAIDMFLSDNITNSTGLGSPVEVMIWLWYVPAILPLGHSESTPDIDTVAIAGTNFSLYHGWNAQGQDVFSWLPHQNLTSTNADYSPLLKYIWNKGLLSGALYLGQLEFGTEVMHAGLSTTFSASDYSLQLYRQGDADDPNKPTPTSASSTATQTASSRASSAMATTTGSSSSVISRPAATGAANASLQPLATLYQHAILFLGLWPSIVLSWGWWHRMDVFL